MPYPKLSFRQITKEDEKLILSWLASDHVKKWFYGKGLKNTIDSLYSYVNKKQTMFTHHLAFIDELPFGYLMTSKIDKPKDEYSKWCITKGKSITLDLLIGDKKFLGKGLAAPMIQQFLHTLEFAEALIDPDIKNLKAIHVYEKAGFKKIGEFTPKKGAMKGKPHLMMRLINP